MSATGMSNGMREEIAQIYSEQAVTLIVGQGCAAVQRCGLLEWLFSLRYIGETITRKNQETHSIAYTKLAKRNSHH